VKVVMAMSGENIELDDPISGDSSVGDLRRSVAAKLCLGDPAEAVLMFDGIALTDSQCLEKAMRGSADTPISMMRRQDPLSHFRPGQRGQLLVKSHVSFPKPLGININMMPFVMGLKSSLPEEYQHYWHLVEDCEVDDAQLGKVGFLTIHECYVPAGQAQRRAGIHTESFRMDMSEKGCVEVDYWGGGGPFQEGGLYMASTVSSSCRLWDLMLETDSEAAAGHLGSLEHMRDFLEGDPRVQELQRVMEANALYWLTDVTPHESLPLRSGSYRQYFRLVTSQVSVWYERHSTSNRLGVVPDPAITNIITADKFTGTAEERCDWPSAPVAPHRASCAIQ